MTQWRKYSGAADAKVILLSHSMGGLVARYYLEAQEGWRNCRALFTFGTPHRGSVNALSYMSNGYKMLFMDLTEAMRSFTSVYQLLPIYEMVKVGDTYQRVAEGDNIPHVSGKRAKDALKFHREIETAANEHWGHLMYRDEYQTIPIVGTWQPTFQSAALSAGQLSVQKKPLQLQTGLRLDDGDGIVPRISATPIELSDAYRDTFVAERHSLLHSHPYILHNVLHLLQDMQTNRKAVRGSQIQQERAEQAAISLDLDDLYLPEEEVELHAKLVNFNEHEHAEGLKAYIEPVDNSGSTIVRDFDEVQDGWRLRLPDLPPGLYRVEVRTQRLGPESPHPVHDFFEIVR